MSAAPTNQPTSLAASLARLHLRRAWDCWRLTLRTGAERVEVTCLADEVNAVADWLDTNGSAAQQLPLPVAEHELRGAGADYRWSKKAWARYERACKNRRDGGPVGSPSLASAAHHGRGTPSGRRTPTEAREGDLGRQH